MNNILKKTVCSFLVFCSLAIASCQSSANCIGTTAETASETEVQRELLPIHELDDNRIAQATASEIKYAYYEYTIRQNYTFEGKPQDVDFDPTDIFIQLYAGKFGNCHTVMMGGDLMDYTQAIRTVSVAGYSITFRSGQLMYAYENGGFYTLAEAFEKGLLSASDICEIGKAIDPSFDEQNPTT